MAEVKIQEVKPEDLRPGDHVSVLIFGKDCVSTKYCRYTGLCHIDYLPDINEIRLFDNGLWMWDGEKWTDVTRCYMEREIHEDRIPDEEIPFCDFNYILEEEMGVSDCL